MKLPPREATAEGDLTVPFQQSALKSTADQDPLFHHVKIRYVKQTDPPAQVAAHLMYNVKLCSVKREHYTSRPEV